MKNNTKRTMRHLSILLKKIDKMSIKVKTLEKCFNQKGKLLTIEETISRYGISRSTIERYRKRGLKVGQPIRNGQIYIDETELQNFLKNNKKW